MIKNQAMIAEMHLKLALSRRATIRRSKLKGKQLKNIILTGPARSGKSILSRSLERDIGYIPFRMDSVGGYVRAYTDKAKRQKKINLIMESLLKDIPAGLCIEGSSTLRGENYNFVDGNVNEKFFRLIARSKDLNEAEKIEAFTLRHSQIDLVESLRISKENNALLVLVGSLEDPKAKAEGMRIHRETGKCWTSKYCTSEELYYLALDNYICSKRLLELSIEHKLLFIDLQSDDFERSIRRATKQVLDLQDIPYISKS